MGSINNALGTNGSGYPLTVLGQTWTMQPITQRDKGALETWAQRRAYRHLARVKDLLDPEDYQRELAHLREAVEADEFAFTSQRVRKALDSYEGRLETLRLTFAKAHPGITLDQVEAILEADPEQVSLALHALHPDLAEAEEQEGEQREPFRGPA